jgi:hypothetical protein
VGQPAGTCDSGAYEVQASTTVLVGSPNPAGIGQTVTYTATVTGLGGSPTGTVSFTDNGVPIPGCTAVPLVNGVATCTVAKGYPVSQVGVHTIVATYSGDATFPGSSATFLERVQGCSVVGALAAGGQRLGVAVSSDPTFNIHYLTFHSGTSSGVVRNPTIVICIGAGTANATVTITGTTGSPSKGGIGAGDAISATLTLVKGAPGTATVMDITTGKTFTFSAPFQSSSSLRISVP